VVMCMITFAFDKIFATISLNNESYFIKNLRGSSWTGQNHINQKNDNFSHLLSGKINKRSHYRVFIDGWIKLIWILENR
jgi:hypothetical protein